jgi:hypothetical protein
MIAAEHERQRAGVEDLADGVLDGSVGPDGVGGQDGGVAEVDHPQLRERIDAGLQVISAMNIVAATARPRVELAALCQPTRMNRYLPAISDSVAITITSAAKMAKPVVQPRRGPSARVTQAKLVPQSGSARFSAR